MKGIHKNKLVQKKQLLSSLSPLVCRDWMGAIALQLGMRGVQMLMLLSAFLIAQPANAATKCILNLLYGTGGLTGNANNPIDNKIYTLSTLNGAITQRGTFSFPTLASARRQTTGNVYYLENINGTPRLAYWDPDVAATKPITDTTANTIVGPLNGTGTPIPNQFAKLAFSAGGTLYGMDDKTTRLYSINPDTANTTFVTIGNAPGNAVAFAGGSGDLAFDPNNVNQFYVTSLQGGTSKLFKVDISNPAAPVATYVGDTGITVAVGGLAFGQDGLLYGTRPANGDVYRVSTTNAATTLIGNSQPGITDLATLPLPTKTDIAVTKDDAQTFATPGSPISYTLTVTNVGDPTNPPPPGAACTLKSLKLTDAVPPQILSPTFGTPSQGTYQWQGTYNPSEGDWTGLDLAPGQSMTITLSGTVDPNATTDIVNTATVAAPEGITDTNLSNNSSTDTDKLSADVVTTKTGPATVAPNGSITYTITATNNGAGTATNVVIKDTLPSGVTNVSSSDGGIESGGVVTWPAIASLAKGATATRTVTVTAPASGGPFQNSASSTSDTLDPTPANNDGSSNAAKVTTTISSADVVTTKTGPATVAPNGSITYTITTTNNGPSAATNVVIKDTLPSGVTYLSSSDSGTESGGVVTWPAIATLASNANVTYTLTVQAPTAGGPFVNKASSTSETSDPTPANNDGSGQNAQVSTTITDSADVVTTKTGPATVAPNGSITYTITTTNNGPSAATNVVIKDTLPTGVTYVSSSDSGSESGGVVTWPAIASLPSGASTTRTLTVQAPTAGGPFVNKASSTSDTSDPTPANNDGSGQNSQVPTTIADSADVVTTKTGPSTVAPNGSITYTITTINNGPSAATNVVIKDTLPTGVTYVSSSDSGTESGGVVTWPAIASLPSGASTTRTLTVNAPTSGSPFVNKASSTSDTSDPTPANNDGSGQNAQVSTTIGDSADVVTTKTGPSTVTPNGSITYTITTINNGPSAATNVVIKDTLPSGVTYLSSSDSGTESGGVVTWPAIASLPSGASTTRTLTVQAPASGSPFVNKASSTSDTADPTPANNDGSGQNAQVPTTIGDSADVVTTKTGPSTVTPNGSITYTITTINNGPSAATNVVIKDTLPSGVTYLSSSDSGTESGGVVTWPAIASLASGQSVSYTLTVNAPTSGGPFVNQASSTSNTPDPTPANNDGSQQTAQVSTTVAPASADLTISKTVNNANPRVGDNITYTITVTNNGPSTATGVQVTDQVPAGLTYISDNSGGTYNASTGVWTVGSIANGANATLTITAKVNTSTPQTNTARISGSDTPDPDTSNNQDSVTVPNQEADLAVTKTANNGNPKVGENITYTITVTNKGPSTATGVQVTDKLPAGLAYVSGTPSSGTYNPGNGVWTVGTIANGANATLTITATVNSASPQTNTATVTGLDQTDPNPTDDQDSVTVPSLEADLAVRKTVNNSSPTVGENITYTVTVTNTGPNAATGVQVSDQLPSGLTFVSAAPSVGSYTSSNGVWTVGSLANGASATLQIVATVNNTNSITNTARVSGSDQPDPTPGNNQQSVAIAKKASLRLVKRITAIGVTSYAFVRDNPNDSNDDSAVGWPSNYLQGEFTNVSVKPGDEIEYTIYFLSDGGGAAEKVIICDPLQNYQTFIPNSFDGQTPRDGGFATDLGIALAINSSSPTVYLTDDNDPPDRGRFYFAGNPAPAACGPNSRGAVVVNVGQLSPGSYGFVRFRVKVD